MTWASRCWCLVWPQGWAQGKQLCLATRLFGCRNLLDLIDIHFESCTCSNTIKFHEYNKIPWIFTSTIVNENTVSSQNCKRQSQSAKVYVCLPSNQRAWGWNIFAAVHKAWYSTSEQDTIVAFSLEVSARSYWDLCRSRCFNTCKYWEVAPEGDRQDTNLQHMFVTEVRVLKTECFRLPFLGQVTTVSQLTSTAKTGKGDKCFLGSNFLILCGPMEVFWSRTPAILGLVDEENPNDNCISTQKLMRVMMRPFVKFESFPCSREWPYDGRDRMPYWPLFER